jgi:Fur family ferric uptake transcriptional regulator
MNETALFEQFIAEKQLRHSNQRQWILTVFLRIEKHMTIDELLREVKAIHPEVGSATVYRTLRLLCECGLCRELRFDNGPARYEHLYGHEHHDHLICTQCGTSVEIISPEIEHLQEELIKQHGFIPQRHRMELYGVCNECAGK